MYTLNAYCLPFINPSPCLGSESPEYWADKLPVPLLDVGMQSTQTHIHTLVILYLVTLPHCTHAPFPSLLYYNSLALESSLYGEIKCYINTIIIVQRKNIHCTHAPFPVSPWLQPCYFTGLKICSLLLVFSCALEYVI